MGAGIVSPAKRFASSRKFMDKQEAKSILVEYLSRYRTKSHVELAAIIGEVDALELRGPSGKDYQIEVQQVMWDDPQQPGANIRSHWFHVTHSSDKNFRPIKRIVADSLSRNF